MKPLHDPIADGLITLAYNKLLEEFEEPFEVEIVRGHREFRIISEQLAWSVKNNAHVLIEDLSRDDLLVAFQLMVGEAPVSTRCSASNRGRPARFDQSQQHLVSERMWAGLWRGCERSRNVSFGVKPHG